MSPSVKDFIKSRQMAGNSVAAPEDDDELVSGSSPYGSIANPPAPQSDEEDESPDSAQNPALSDLDAQQSALRDTRQAGLQASGIVNLGNAFSQLAQGSNKPTPNAGLYSDLNKQNATLVSGAEGDIKQRTDVMKAIQAANARKYGVDASTQKAQNSLDESKRFHDEDIASRDRRTNAITGNQANRMDATNIRAASGLFKDPNVSKEVTKLNAAHSAQTLIGEIESGQLVDTKSVRNQLTNILTTIELGGGGGQGDRHAMGVDNLYSRVKDALGNLDSGAESTISPAMLKQIKTEANALGDRAATNYKAMTDSTISGADLSGGDPDVDPGKIAALAKQRQKAFLKNAGYDPETGARPGAVGPGPAGPSPADKQALDWLKANPSDPAAAKVKAKLAAKGLL